MWWALLYLVLVLIATWVHHKICQRKIESVEVIVMPTIAILGATILVSLGQLKRQSGATLDIPEGSSVSFSLSDANAGTFVNTGDRSGEIVNGQVGDYTVTANIVLPDGQTVTGVGEFSWREADPEDPIESVEVILEVRNPE